MREISFSFSFCSFTFVSSFLDSIRVYQVPWEDANEKGESSIEVIFYSEQKINLAKEVFSSY